MNIVTRSVPVSVGMVFLVGAVALAEPAADIAAAATEIHKNTASWIAAYNAADVEAIMTLYVPDAVIMPPGAPRASGHAAIRQFLAKDTAAARAAGVSLVLGPVNDIAVSGDVAWHAGTYSVVDGKSGAEVDSGSYLETCRKVDGKWLIVRDIWNSARPAPGPAPAPATGVAPK